MKKGIVMVMMIVNALASYCHTENFSKLNDKVKEYLIAEYFNECETREDGQNLIISIVVDKTSKDAIQERLKGIDVANIKKKMIDSVDQLGLNSGPYENMEFVKEFYSDDNPLFSLQKGWIAYIVATSPYFKEFADIHIVYQDGDGNPAFRQTINGELKEIAKQLSEMKMTEKEVAMLIAEKTGLDAGVKKNKEMTPYQLDLLSTMQDIEITDNAYTYYVSIPTKMAKRLSPDDYSNIGKDLNNLLNSQVRSIKFYNTKGADRFRMELIYIYIDSSNSEKLIKYVFNPYTLDCDVVPLSPAVIEKFSIKEASNNNFGKWAELNVFKSFDQQGLGTLPKLKMNATSPTSVTGILGMDGDPQFLFDRGYSFFLSIGKRVSQKLMEALKQSSLSDDNYEITVIFVDTTDNKDIIKYKFYLSEENRFEVEPLSNAVKKLRDEENLAGSDFTHWLLVRGNYAIKSRENWCRMKLLNSEILNTREVLFDIELEQSEIPYYEDTQDDECVRSLQAYIYNWLEYDSEKDQFSFLSGLKVSDPGIISIRLLDGKQRRVVKEAKIKFPNENGGYSDY